MECHLHLNDKKQITQWIGKRMKYNLLYKASRDGCSAKDFHVKCDNKGPTVTVLYDLDNSVYGGYTSLHWDSSGKYKDDSDAFLFRLYQTNSWNPVQMKVKDGKKATFCKSSYGPTFGGETYMWFWNIHDLKTFSGKIELNGTYFPLNGSTDFGTSYTMNGETYYTIANGHLKVKDLEVYVVEAYAAMLTEPWTSPLEWTSEVMEDLEEKIQSYKPKQDLVPHVNLLMIGQVKAGKSSFFNTVNSIFRGRISGQASTGHADHSYTTAYRKYQIFNKSDKPLKFRLHDTRGIEKGQGILDKNQIGYILDGNLPDNYKFNSSVPISKDTPGFVNSPSLSDKIHCVVIVVDGSTATVMPDDVAANIKNMQTHIRVREIPQVVLLTKIDKICENTAEDVSQVFYSPLIEDTVNQVSKKMGLPKAHILPARNYETESKLHDHINILALRNLQQMLNFADDCMYNYLKNPKENNIETKN